MILNRPSLIACTCVLSSRPLSFSTARAVTRWLITSEKRVLGRRNCEVGESEEGVTLWSGRAGTIVQGRALVPGMVFTELTRYRAYYSSDEPQSSAVAVSPVSIDICLCVDGGYLLRIAKRHTSARRWKALWPRHSSSLLRNFASFYVCQGSEMDSRQTFVRLIRSCAADVLTSVCWCAT